MAVKIPQVVGNLPSPPNPADRSTFNTLAYPWSEALTPWTNEMNQLAADTYDNALDVQGASTVTGSDRDIALGAANAASVDAGLAKGYKNEALASKQSASTSAGLADASRSDAQTAALAAAAWATSTTVVSGGNKGAKGYALDAAQSAADAASTVLGEVFDNTQESAAKGWTSSKIVAWFNGLTTTFTRTLLSRTNAAQARTDLELGDAATKTVGTSAGNLMAVGAGGWLGQGVASASPLAYPASVADITNLTKTIRSEAEDNGIIAYAAGIHFSTEDTWGRLRVAYLGSRAWVQGGNANNGSGWTAELYHDGNTLNIGTTAATARTALNLFADTSGVMTNGTGQLSSDMSDFLSSDTFDEMSSKVGGGGEIDFTTLADNAAALTPVPGKAYWLTRTGTAALTTYFTCSHAPGKIRTWHVIVSKGSGANDGFIPNFSVSGLTETSVRWSGGGTIKPTISGVSHVMIMFMQIDQNVRATIVDGW